MLTIKHILERSGDIPLAQAPFGKEIYFACTMREIEVDISHPCSEILRALETIKGQQILTLPIDELATGTETKTNNTIAVWCFRLTMVMVFILGCMTAYIAFSRNEFPEFGLTLVVICIPAMVMWNRMNLLKHDKAKAVGTLFSSVMSLRTGRKVTQDEEPQETKPKRGAYIEVDDDAAVSVNPDYKPSK